MLKAIQKLQLQDKFLNDVEFLEDKNKVIEYVKQSSNAQIKEEVLAAL